MANSKVITRNDIQNILAHINLGDDAHREITQAEFNALSLAEKNNGTIYFITDGVSGNAFLEDNVPIGTITPYGGDSDPDYWLICDGRAISRTTYADLFVVIGTTYGIGDGSTTFNIPDLRGNIVVGASTVYNLGDSGGEATHTLQTSEIPAHTHGSKSLSGAFSVRKYGNNYNMVPSTSGICTSADTTGQGYATDTTSTQYALQRVEINATHEHTSVGSGQAHNNMQPYVVTNYIIKASSTISEHQATVDFFYPVGSYYETSDSTFDPNTTWGGTWTTETTAHIIDEGTSGIWKYKKWSDGTYEAWGYYQANNLVLTTSSAGTYYGSSQNILYPNIHVGPLISSTYGNTTSQGSGIYIYNTEDYGDSGLHVNYRAHTSVSSGVCGGYFYIKSIWTSTPTTLIKWHRVA